jgi:hypothetical protein
MASYRFALLGTDGGLHTSCTMQCSSEDEACDIGSELLMGSKLNVLKIWRGTTMVFRVAKVDRERRKSA